MRLIAEGLTCVRGDRQVFAGVSFAVAAGEALAVTGRNGAGKSSLLRLVAGLIAPAGGTLALEGGDSEATIGEQAHYLGHLDALKPSLTVLENLEFWTKVLGAGAPPAPDSLEAVGIGALGGLPAGYLSAGQKRRLSLARLLSVKRPLWLLDEPTAALDVAAQAMFAGLVRTHLAGGGLVLVATHQPLDVPTRELALAPGGPLLAAVA
jgi:heme exporter protein A